MIKEVDICLVVIVFGVVEIDFNVDFGFCSGVRDVGCLYEVCF